MQTRRQTRGWASGPLGNSLCGFPTVLLLLLLQLLVVNGHSVGEESDDPGRLFDYNKLAHVVRERGIDAVIKKLDRADSKERVRRLVAALDHVRHIVREDPEQLWFQLCSRTRLEGWEDFQQSLLVATPENTLLPLTSSLNQVHPGVVRTWRFGEEAIRHLALSSDGSEIYCGTEAGRFVVLDANTHALVRDLSVSGSVLTTLRGPGGRDVFMAASGLDPHFGRDLHDVQTGEVKVRLKVGLETEYPFPPPVQITPDGRHLVCGTENISFLAQELPDLQDSFVFRSKIEPTRCRPLFIALVDEGRRLYSVDDRGYLREFGYPEGKELRPPRRLLPRIHVCSLSPDESRLAVSRIIYGPDGGRTSDSEMVVWDLAERREVAKYEILEKNLASAAFLDAETVVTGGYEGHVQVWKTDTSRPIATIQAHDSSVIRICRAPDGKRVFTGDFLGFVKLVDPLGQIAEERPLPPRASRAFRRYFCPDGRWEAGFSAGRVTIWSVGSDEPRYQLDLPKELLWHVRRVTSIGIGLDEKVIHLGGQKAIGRWYFEYNDFRKIAIDVSGFPRKLNRRERPPLSVFVSPDGERAVAWELQNLAVFDVETGQQRFLISPGCWFGGVHFFLSNERLALTYRDSPLHGVRVFDLTTGRETANHVHGFFQNGVACAHAADLLVTVGKRRHEDVQEPQTIAIWRPGLKAEFLDAPGQVGLMRVGITPDGKRAVTASFDGIVLLWDLSERRVMRRFDLEIRIESLAFDGTTLVVTEPDTHTRHVFQYCRRH